MIEFLDRTEGIYQMKKLRSECKKNQARQQRAGGITSSEYRTGIKRVDQPYRISGHESFPCRYTWLPKAMRGLRENPRLFSEEVDAMVGLGVGKNMVRSIRFWSQATGIAEPLARGAGHQPTPLGRLVLDDGGFDPFLEDIRTLWLIHWNLSTDSKNPLLAWDYLLNRWHETDLVPSRVLNALKQEASKQDDSLSMVTLEQHFETFLHTYIPTRGRIVVA